MTRRSDRYEAVYARCEGDFPVIRVTPGKYVECTEELAALWSDNREVGAFECLSRIDTVLHVYAVNLAHAFPKDRRRSDRCR